MASNYGKGFDNASLPKPSDDEDKKTTNVTYTLKGKCIDMLSDNKKKIRGCQLLYIRNTKYNPDKGDKRECEFVFLEANIYSKNLDLTELVLKYAYWFPEDSNNRSKIFCRKLENDDELTTEFNYYWTLP